MIRMFRISGNETIIEKTISKTLFFFLSTTVQFTNSDAFECSFFFSKTLTGRVRLNTIYIF